jgi:subtilisin family serine protease
VVALHPKPLLSRLLPRPVVAALLGGLIGGVSSMGWAQVPLGALEDFFAARGARRVAGHGALFATGARPYGLGHYGTEHVHWVPVNERYAVLRVADAGLSRGSAAHALGSWAPPRHLLLDRARASLRVEAASAAGAGTGQGVVIGIVDTGVDVAHPDLRNADGTTRVAWWIDFSSNPAGRHAALESELGCQPEVGLRCRILDAADLDELLGNGVSGDEPRDVLGHGTHVASIAAGNGLFQAGGFVGVAPEATLIVARVTGAVGTIADSDVVLATRFVFEQAALLGMPAVVNLSLGGDFGAHDGSSELSQVLASFVGTEQPGRAIVVAGGNSGQVLYGLTDPTLEPLGIHTEVPVPSRAPVSVPLLTPYPANGRDVTDASLFVWINLYPANALSVALELPDGRRTAAIGPGQVETTRSGDLVAAVIHGLGGPAQRDMLAADLPELQLAQALPSAGAAVILIDGQWPAGSNFSIELTGQGRAELWVQSEGDLAPEAGTVGALFTRATPQQTVTIPATHPALIAVGASINRLDWTDRSGALIRLEPLSASPPLAVGGAAFFSSAGPNARGDVKPDVLAPGGFVVAALSSAADPQNGGAGVFSGGLCAGADCQVVSAGYALTAGTSMAAPMVSGAAALLLERDATLTQDRLRSLLQAGSEPALEGLDVAGREGGGVVSVAGSFDAMTTAARSSAQGPDAEQSRLRFAAAFAVPDSTRSVSALLWLRDATGAVFDAAIERVRVAVRGGALSQVVERLGPGLYRFRLAAADRGAGDSMRVECWVDDQLFLASELPIDVGARRSSGGGGCSAAVEAPRARWPNAGPSTLALVAVGSLARRRFRSRRGIR